MLRERARSVRGSSSACGIVLQPRTLESPPSCLASCMTAPSLQVQFDPSSARFGASRSQKRIEDDRLLTGKGRYSDDLEFPRQCWLVLVRSPHAHAKITGIDLSAAKAAEGVI